MYKELVYHFLCIYFPENKQPAFSQGSFESMMIFPFFTNGSTGVRCIHTVPKGVFFASIAIMTTYQLVDVTHRQRWEVNMVLQLAPEEGNLNGQAIRRIWLFG